MNQDTQRNILIVSFLHAPSGTPLIDLCGLPLGLRHLLSAQAAGFTEIMLLVRTEDESELKTLIEGVSRVRAAAKIVACSGPAAAWRNLPDLADADEAAVALGDRAWTQGALAILARPLDNGSEARILVESADRLEHSGLVRAKVRHLAFEAVDGDAPESSLASAVERSAGAPERIDVKSIGPVWRKIRGAHDTADAERLLLSSLVKTADGVIAKTLNRRISITISKRLAKLDVTPNQVTAVVFLIGIVSGVFASFGTYLGFLLGGFCYYFSAVLDGCDGELSRLKHMGTPLGAWLDTVVDDAVGLSYIAGMYIGLHRNADHSLWLYWGIFAVVCYLLTMLPRYYIFATRLGAGDHQKLAAGSRKSDPGPLARAAHRVRDIVFRTDFLPFAAFATAALHAVPVFAVPYPAGAAAAMVDTIVTMVRFFRPTPTLN